MFSLPDGSIAVGMERKPYCSFQILVERSDKPFAAVNSTARRTDDVERTRYWIGGHREPASEGLDIDQSKSIRPAGKDEDVCCRVGRRQLCAMPRPEKQHVRMGLL